MVVKCLNFPSCPLCPLWLILTFASAHPIRPAACRSMPSTPGRYGSKSLNSSWAWGSSNCHGGKVLEFSFVPFVSFVVDFDLHFCPPHPPGRMPFDALHAWSVRLEVAELVMGL